MLDIDKDHVDLAAAEGSELALLGLNGCGKTTTVGIFAARRYSTVAGHG